MNARISDRSWPRYRRFRGLMRKLLANVDLFLGADSEDAARLQDHRRPRRIGCELRGNLKFDIPAPVPPAIVEEYRTALAASGAGPVLVCGSTVEGEESLLLKAFENVLVQYPQAVMILAPRHPERFPAVAALLEQMSIRFSAKICVEWRTAERRGVIAGYDRGVGCAYMRLPTSRLWAEAWCRAADTTLLNQRNMALPSSSAVTRKIFATS